MASPWRPSSLGAPSTVTSARHLLIGFAGLPAIGILTAWQANRPAHQPKEAVSGPTGPRQGS